MAFNIPAAEPSPEELAAECLEASENAVEWVKSMSGIDLDYSPPSLIALDRILSELVNTLPKEDMEPTVVLLGSYLGEVLLMSAGGRWETGDVFTGPGLRGLGGKEIIVNPLYVIRQAFNKHEDHIIARYWNSVVKKISEASDLEDAAGFKPAPGETLKMLPDGKEQVKGNGEGPTETELADVIPKETKKFVEILKSDLGVELDFTLGSLKFLDHYLRSLHEKLKKEGQMGERRIFVYLAGNYLGEVLRREYGGKWVYIPQHQTTGLVIKGKKDERTIYPHKAAAMLAMEYKAGGVIAYADKIKRGIKLL